MAVELVQCIECERVFQQFRDDVWTCGECIARERERASRGGGVKTWKDTRARNDMLRFLKLSPAEQIRAGRQARFKATKRGTPGELPTCSKCAKISVLDPCRACAPADATLEYWHGTMSRSKAKKKRR